MPEADNAVPETQAAEQQQQQQQLAPLPDEVLLNAEDVARAALLEITEADTIGRVVGHVVEGEHVLSLLFENTMTGYPGWHWTVTLSRIDENEAPFVLETELMPGDESLLAPDWVPWSDRLADYRAAQEATAALAAENAEADSAEGSGDGADEADDDSDDDLDDDDDLDEDDDLDDDDDFDEVIDHDIDGVDFEHDDSSDDEDDDEESDDDQSDDDESDDDDDDVN